MTKVLIAGFLHETNTFSSTPAAWANFVNGEGFPRMHQGEELFELSNVNIPLGGFVNSAPNDWELIPTIWCAASPSGPVSTETYERVATQITQACLTERPDAVYLDLHGAMVAEDYSDADGELIRRVREVVGPSVPIIVSLDLHANVSDLMAETADGMVAYRTYPHIDMAETGQKCARLLSRVLEGHQVGLCLERLDFLIPTISGSTLAGPAKDVYRLVQSLSGGGMFLSVAMAFPATDVPECRPCVFGYGEDKERLTARIRTLSQQIADHESSFAIQASPVNDAVQMAVENIQEGIRPVIIADTQDNPGAGGDANTTGVLRTLIEYDAPRSACAAMHDSQIVERAVQAGVGANIRVRFPGSEIAGDAPLEATFEVENISDGDITFDGPMMRGNRLSVGPSVVLKHSNVRVVVNNHKAQIMDRNQFRAAGIEPEQQNILAVKSSVHFRADYTPIAGNVIVALAPGPFPVDPTQLPWRNLTPGVRLRPMGPAFQKSPLSPSGEAASKA